MRSSNVEVSGAGTFPYPLTRHATELGSARYQQGRLADLLQPYDVPDVPAGNLAALCASGPPSVMLRTR